MKPVTSQKIQRWLHKHADHRLCREVEVEEQVEVGRDYTQKWLSMKQPDGTTELLDITSIFGEPRYATRKVKRHVYAEPGE